MLPDLSIRQLEYLVAVADSPSWAVAAGSVGVSASALSQGLAELERRVGVPLFERSGRRRLLRESASPVLDHARHVIGLTGDLSRWAQRTSHGDVGRARIGMIDVGAVNHYPGVLHQFREAHPELQLHLSVEPSGVLLEHLVGGRLDLVVCVEPHEPIPGVETRALLTEQLAIYRPSTAPLGNSSQWGPWVLFPSGSHTRRIISSALRGLGSPLEVMAESHQPEVLREMVLLGLGWTVLPVVQAETADRPLHRGRILTERTLVSAIRSGSVLDPAVALLQTVLSSPQLPPNPTQAPTTFT